MKSRTSAEPAAPVPPGYAKQRHGKTLQELCMFEWEWPEGTLFPFGIGMALSHIADELSEDPDPIGSEAIGDVAANLRKCAMTLMIVAAERITAPPPAGWKPPPAKRPKPEPLFTLDGGHVVPEPAGIVGARRTHLTAEQMASATGESAAGLMSKWKRWDARRRRKADAAR